MGQVSSVTVSIKGLTLAELATMTTDLGNNENVSINLAPFGGNLADLPDAAVTISNKVADTWTGAETTILNTILGKHDGA